MKKHANADYKFLVGHHPIGYTYNSHEYLY